MSIDFFLSLNDVTIPKVVTELNCRKGTAKKMIEEEGKGTREEIEID